MKPHNKFWYLFLIIALLVISCDVSTLAAPQVIPTAAPGAIGTIVAQTAAAASTQTAALLPPTMTPSFTPFPTRTASATPSPTETFVFKLPTLTKTPIPTATQAGGGSGGGGGGGSSGGGSDWTCKVTGQNPKNSAHIAAGALFNANWNVQNTGIQGWLNTTVDIAFVSGTRMAAKSLYDLQYSVNPGASTTITIPMKAPGKKGTYTTSWTLEAGKVGFCGLSLTIVVP
jgi:hypothetical protein